MNQRTDARQGFRDKARLGLLLLSLCLCGCALGEETKRVWFLAHRTVEIEPGFFRYGANEKATQRAARGLAETAWAEVASSDPNAILTVEFENGFVEGFADYLYKGGSGEPPAIPPRGFWNLPFRNQMGKAAIQQWSDGFRRGAQECKARGLRERVVVPASSLGLRDDAQNVVTDSPSTDSENTVLIDSMPMMGAPADVDAVEQPTTESIAAEDDSTDSQSTEDGGEDLPALGSGAQEETDALPSPDFDDSAPGSDLDPRPESDGSNFGSPDPASDLNTPLNFFSDPSSATPLGRRSTNASSNPLRAERVRGATLSGGTIARREVAPNDVVRSDTVPRGRPRLQAPRTVRPALAMQPSGDLQHRGRPKSPSISSPRPRMVITAPANAPFNAPANVVEQASSILPPHPQPESQPRPQPASRQELLPPAELPPINLATPIQPPQQTVESQLEEGFELPPPVPPFDGADAMPANRDPSTSDESPAIQPAFVGSGELHFAEEPQRWKPEPNRASQAPSRVVQASFVDVDRGHPSTHAKSSSGPDRAPWRVKAENEAGLRFVGEARPIENVRSATRTGQSDSSRIPLTVTQPDTGDQPSEINWKTRE